MCGVWTGMAASCLRPSDLVGWWPGDGSARDLGGALHGVLSGDAAFEPARLGQGFRFSGAGAVEVPNAPGFAIGTGDFSVEFWARFNRMEHNATGVLSKDSYTDDLYTATGWVINACATCGDGTFGAGGGGFGIETRDIRAGVGGHAHARWPLSNFSTGTWYHIAAVRRSSVLYLYVDGVLRASTPEPTPINVNTGAPLTMGTLNSVHTQGMDGQLDEVVIHNRALSEWEIQTTVAAGGAGRCKDFPGAGSPSNLVVNGGFEAGNFGFGSDYAYNAASTSAEGAFSVVTNPRDVLGAFYPATDPVNGTGRMLVVNGATLPGLAVWKQTVAVQPNTPYRFSAKVANLVDSAPPEMELYVNGARLGVGHPIPVLPIGHWRDVTEVWASGDATTAALEIRDARIEAGGNDFAVDDIGFSADLPGVVTMSADVRVNVGESTTLSVTPFGTPPLTFQWFKDGQEIAGATGATLTLNDLKTSATGDYSVVIRNTVGSYTSSAIAVRFTVDSAVGFADANLETAVRNALGKPTGPLTVGDLESLQQLESNNTGIRDLSGLEVARNIRSLGLRQNPIQDIRPLAGLFLLNSLALERNQIVDITPLQLCAGIEYLGLDGNPLSSLNPIARMSRLLALGINDCSLADLNVFRAASFPRLLNLGMYNNRAADLGFLEGIKATLESLSVGANRLKSIAPLRGAQHLRSLQISANPILDWDTIQAGDLPALQGIEAQEASMFDLEWVRQLPQVTRLNVSWNRIRDVTPLTAQTHISSLDLRGNPVTDISPLAALPPLEALGVSNMMLDVSPGSAADAVIQHLTSTGGSVEKQDQRNPPGEILRVANQSTFGGDWFDVGFSAAPMSEGSDVASVTVHSSNQSVLADSELLVRGLGVSWGVRASTRAGVQGTTTVTLTAHRLSGGTQQASFEVQVIDRRAGTVYIEAEDFDFDHGKTLASGSIGMSGPYAGGAFRGLGSVADKGIDWDDNGPANGSNAYRSGPASEIPSYTFDSRPEYFSRGSFDVEVNYALRWTENGRWQNYTRTFPAGYYYVFAAQTLLGDSSLAKMDEIVSGVGSMIQRTRALGKFDWYGGAPSWDALVHVPLKDSSGEWARVYLSGKRTLRYTDAWPAVDYLSFVPVPSSDPGIEAQPPDVLASVGGSATLGVTPVGTGPFTFQWRKNGVDLPGKTSATLSFENLQLGATGDYTVEVRNAAGSYVSPRIQLSFDPATTVSIPDARLEAAVRDTLGKPSGGLTVEDMERLSRLDLGGRGVRDLTGLETALNLTWLNLSVDGGLPTNAPERALDIAVLAQLTRLEYLNLSGLALRSIEVFRSLSALTGLEMPNWWNVVDIQDYSPLNALKSLRGLEAGAHRLGTLDTIRDLRELRNLTLNWGVVTNIAAVAGFTKLEGLAIANSDLTTIEGLRGLQRLGLLDLGIFNKPSALGLNELTNVLSTLTNLNWLSIAGRPVTSASQIAPALRRMPRLGHLVLEGTPLEDGAALAEFTRLGALQLSNTRLTSLAFLKPLSQLRYLTLENGARTMRIPRGEWDVLSQLPELRDLSVRYQSVRDLDFLRGMNLLERLNIGDLQVTDLAPIRSLPNLNWLFAEGGVLSEMSDVESLAQLRELFVNNNYLDPADGSADRQLIARLEARGVVIRSFFPQRSDIPSALSIGEVSVLSGSTVFRTFLAADRARVGSLTSISASSDNASVVRSADIAVRGRGPVRSIEIPTLSAGEGTATITLTAAYSDATPAVASFPIKTLKAGAGSLFIEAEDFDFDHGHWVQDQPIGVGGPYFGGSYQGRGSQADQGYDLNMWFQDRFSGYRPGVSAAVLDTNLSQDPETNTRGTFDVVVNHVLVWQDQGNWYQYTRDFPAGFYHAYARTSLESLTEHFSLSQVTAGAGTRDAATKPLGSFDRVVSTTSQRYHFVPMRDRNSGELETIYLNGVSTLRLESDGYTAPWVDYMVLVPAAAPDPGIATQPPDVVARVGDTIRLAVTPVGTGPFTFQWRKNGRDLPGQTAAELALSNASLPLTGFYQVVIQGANGRYESQEIAVNFHPTSAVSIPDAKLETAVRSALGKAAGGLTVGDMQRLTRLDLSNLGVLSLSGLETAVNLTWLNLEVNGGLPVDAPERQLDVRVLGQFTRLGWLNLTGLGLRSIEFLRSMPGLTDLVFNNWSTAAAVTDFSPLSALRSLRSLGMEVHRIPSLAPLRGLPSLFSLGLNWCDIGDATDLAGIPSLQNLSLFNVSFPSARFFAGMTQLVNLNIGIVIGGSSLVPVAELQQSLGGLVNLETLDLSGRPFRRSAEVVDLLSHLPRLRGLWLAGCPLEEGSGLAAFPQLTQLALAETYLTDIRFLASLPNLDYLGARNYTRRLRIPEAQWGILRSLTKLQSVDLAGQRIGRLGFLDACVALRDLNIDDSRVTDLGPLASLPQLQNILARGSLLADLTPALAFPSLRNLWADNAPLLPPSAQGGRDVIGELRAKGVNISATTQLTELPTLSTAGMRTTVDGLVRGFTGTIHQADNGTYDNTLLRAEQQLANVFGASAQATPFFENSALNYDNDEADQGRFGDSVNFPKLPGFGRDRLVLSATGYVQLKAGWYVMGVNSDDGFAVSSGFAPLYRPAAGSGVWERDNAVTVLGSFDGGRGSADTTFLVHATQDGLYPLRLLWEEGGGGANLEWWIVDLQRPPGEREVTLVNDLSKPNAVAAFTAPPAANTAPVVTVESSLSILAGAPLPLRVRLHVTDSETPTREIFGSMPIQVRSSNLAAVPADALRLVREPAALWLEILPDRTAGGMAVVEIQATDAGGLSGVGRLEVRVVDPANAVGYLRREIYSGIANGNLSSLRDDPRFPSDPSRSELIVSAESPSLGDNYGQRIFAYLMPPVTGDYVFYIASNDQGELWLSTDASPAHVQRIANEPVWNNFRAYQTTDRRNPALPENRSLPIRLEAGKAYYFEALMAEGGGGDNLSIAWQMPGGTPPADGSEPIPGRYFSVTPPTPQQLAQVLANAAGQRRVNPSNGHVYYLLPPSSWQEAEAAAQALGGHLASINDASEQDWVFSMFGGGIPPVGGTGSANSDVITSNPNGGASIRRVVPAPGASGFSEPTSVTMEVADGAVAVTEITVAFDGADARPTIEKTAGTSIIRFTTPPMAEKSVHRIALSFADGANRVSREWTIAGLNRDLLAYWNFNDASSPATARDRVQGVVGNLFGSARYSADTAGHSGAPGDRALDLTASPVSSSGMVRVEGANFIDPAGAENKLAVVFWQKLSNVQDSSSFWISTVNEGRAAQAHVPWSDQVITFDTMGCCDGATQRTGKPIQAFPGYTGSPDWWKSWHHFAFVKDGDKKSIYVDGQLFHEGTSSAPLTRGFEVLTIGGSHGLPNNFFVNGWMDDFALFAGGLSAHEVALLASGVAPDAIGRPLPSAIGTGARSLWIGLHKADDLSLSWTTGEPVDFTHWYQGSPTDSFAPEPNGGASELFVHMIREGYHPRVPGGTWNDLASPNVNQPAFEPIQGVVELNYDPLLPTPGVLLPPTDQTVSAGGTAVFTVTPNGTGPFTYEWQREGVRLEGQTASSMTLAGAQVRDGGRYRVLIRNAAGSAALSADARLRVLPSGIVGAEQLSLVDQARMVGSTLRLTPAEPALRGAAWLRQRQQVTSGFDTVFQFQLHSPMNVHADGFAFVVQASSVNAIGGSHAGLGYDGIRQALAVAFDTYGNGAPTDPGSGNISVQVGGGDLAHSLANTGTSLGSSLSDGTVHTARVRYDAGDLQVFLDDLVHPVVRVSVDLTPILATGNGQAYVGFTAATGGGAENHDILSWDFRSLPLGGAPLFLRSPEPLVAVFRGQDVLLEAATDGFPNRDSFQWYQDGQPLVDGERVVGALTQRLTIRAAAAGDAGTYRVRATRGGLWAQSPESVVEVHPVAAPEGLGRALIETYASLGGSTIGDLKSWPGFPAHPDQYAFLTEFEVSPMGAFDGRRVTALLWPPVTGDYRFFLAADDGAELWLSSDASAANAALIAREPLWSDARSYQGLLNRNATAPENRSGLVHLESGRGYYVEAILKEGDGQNHLAVAWQLPGAAAPVDGSAPISGLYLSAADPVVQKPLWVTPPQARGFFPGLAGAVEVRAAGVGVRYQWRRNGVDLVDTGRVRGVGTPTLSFAPFLAEDVGDYSVVARNAAGATETEAVRFGLPDPAAFPNLDPAHRVSPDTSKPGFVALVHQVGGPAQRDSLDRAERQLLGLLTDAGGQPLPNVADLSHADLGVRFGIPGPLDLNAFSDGGRGRFAQDVPMPGVPGTLGGADNVAMEILTYLELPQGFVRMGVNSDDGFETSAGLVRDAFQRTVLGSFDGGRGFAETMFEFYVPEAGVYPFRTVYEQGLGGAGIEWFTQAADGRMVLVNDVANGGVRAYQAAANVPVTETPVLLTQPRDGARDVLLQPTISVLVDDPLSKVDLARLVLKVAGVQVAPVTTRSGARVQVAYVPTQFLPADTSVPVSFSFGTIGGADREVRWSFRTSIYTADTKFIEVEDFDYGHGQWVTQKPIGMTGPYAGGAYAGLGTGLGGAPGDGSDYGIDYFELGNGNDQAVYRPGTAVEAGKRNQHADGLVRSTFEVQANYVVGWNGSGEWFNYTRAFPDYGQRYQVLARMSSGGEPMAANLSRVTSGVGTTAQTTESLGDFRAATSTGSWDAFALVELKTPSGVPATPLLYGTNTLRLTVLPGNADLDFLAFIPVPGTEVYPPKIEKPPLSRRVFEGGEIRLDVEASGTGPFTYEWRRGATVLPEVTGPALVVLKATAQDAGSYTVRVRNAIGLATSEPAIVAVDTASVPPVQFSAAAASAGPGATVALPVRVRGFAGVGGLQFSVVWDPAVARLEGVSSFGLNGLTAGSFNFGHAADGVVSLSWDDPQGGSVSLPDDRTLFELNYTLLGSAGASTPVRILGAPTAIEVFDGRPNALPYLVADGSMTVVPSVTLGGKVRFHANPALMVPGVQVAVSGGAARNALTASTGGFNFDLDVGRDYDLTAAKLEETPPSQGVSTLDITVLRRHILSIALLDSPYKLLAADVNRSDSVTTLDITLMRRLILGITNNLPSGAWRFVPSDVVFSNPQVPWGIEAARKHRGLASASSAQDFIGIRMGDVNGSWTPVAPPPPAPGLGDRPANAVDKPLSQEVQNAAAISGSGESPFPVVPPPQRARLAVGGFVHAGAGEFEVPVTVSGISKLGGIQFALRWNPEVLEFVRFAGTDLPRFDDTNLSAVGASRGVFRLSWNDPLGGDVAIADPSKPMPVLRLVFRPRTPAPAVSALGFLREAPTPVELSAGLVLLATELVEQPLWLGRSPAETGLSVPRLGVSGGALEVPTWRGARTVVEVLHDLSRPDWQVLGTFDGNGAAVSVPVPASGPAQGYYRLRLEF